MAQYSVFVWANGDWQCAIDRNMSKSAAEGLFSQFASQHSARLFRGLNVGRCVKSSIRDTDRPAIAAKYVHVD